MKFELTHQAGLRTALVRAARGQIEEAVAGVRRDPTDLVDPVHAVRVASKRMRALWRLLRPTVGEAVYRRENGRLRKAAMALGQYRDAHVIHDGIVALHKRSRSREERDAMRAIRARLGDRQPLSSTEAAGARRAVAQMERSLRASLGAMGKLRLPRDPWNTLEPGYRRAVRNARRSFRKLEKASQRSAADYHEWRKDVKTAYYITELLTPLSPKPLESFADDLKELGRILGEYHDLAMIHERLHGSAGAAPATTTGPTAAPVAPANRKIVDDMITRRSERLVGKAHRLARKMFRSKPRELMHDIAPYAKRFFR